MILGKQNNKINDKNIFEIVIHENSDSGVKGLKKD